MKIEQNRIVRINYTLRDPNGDTLDTSVGSEPLAYLHGMGQLVPGLEAELNGKAAGDKFRVTVAAADGYGERSEEMVQEIPKSSFQEGTEIEKGMKFQAEGNGGVMIITVVDIKDDVIVVDGNHDLAGIPLDFEIEVIEVREASKEELEHGHVHGEGGHHH